MPTITPGSYLESLENLDVPVEFKFQLSLLLGNFNYAMSVLANLMKKVYLLVDQLHNQYAREISMEFERVQTA